MLQEKDGQPHLFTRQPVRLLREGLGLHKERDDRQTSLREAVHEKGLTQLTETGKYQEYTADTLANLAQAVKDREPQRRGQAPEILRPLMAQPFQHLPIFCTLLPPIA